MPLLSGGHVSTAPTLLLLLRFFGLFQVRQPEVHVLKGTADGVVVVQQSLFSLEKSVFVDFHYEAAGACVVARSQCGTLLMMMRI